MRSSLLVATLVAIVPAAAIAGAPVSRDLKAPGTASYGDIVAGPADINGLQFARQVLPPVGVSGTQQALALSKVIYLNKNGVTLTPGNNDARTNKSTLASQTTTIPAYNVTAANWASVVTCMKEEFSRFDVTVTDVDPGQTPHMEAVFGGTPQLLGMPAGVAGVSPFTNDCAIIENSIVFTFTGVLPANDPRLACEIMAQEVAHSYGLDHELLAADPMTYLDYNGNREFQDQMASCGEDVARPCGINGTTCRTNQNSVALLRDRLGLKSGDTTPPTGTITSPSQGAIVPPGFNVYANAADNVAVTGAKLYVDGTMADMKSGTGPFTFVTASSLAEGTHKLKVEVTDGSNTVMTTEITVTVKNGATPPPAPGGSSQDPNGGSDGDVITGGCAAGGSGGSLLLGLALAGLVIRRRK